MGREKGNGIKSLMKSGESGGLPELLPPFVTGASMQGLPWNTSERLEEGGRWKELGTSCCRHSYHTLRMFHTEYYVIWSP